MAIKEFIISPGNYFEDGFFDGDYTERQNQSFATLTCEVERLAGFEFAAGFYFEEGFIEDGAFGVNSIIFTLEAEAMVVQEATINATNYYQDNYFEQGYYADSGSRFTLTIDLGQTVEAQGAFISEFAQVSTVGKLQDVVVEFESLFTPGFTVEAILNSTAILDSVADLTATTSKFTGYESLLEFIAALNAQAARTRLADAALATVSDTVVTAASQRDAQSSLAVSAFVNADVRLANIVSAEANITAEFSQTTFPIIYALRPNPYNRPNNTLEYRLREFGTNTTGVFPPQPTNFTSPAAQGQTNWRFADEFQAPNLAADSTANGTTIQLGSDDWHLSFHYARNDLNINRVNERAIVILGPISRNLTTNFDNTDPRIEFRSDDAVVVTLVRTNDSDLPTIRVRLNSGQQINGAEFSSGRITVQKINNVVTLYVGGSNQGSVTMTQNSQGVRYIYAQPHEPIAATVLPTFDDFIFKIGTTSNANGDQTNDEFTLFHYQFEQTLDDNNSIIFTDSPSLSSVSTLNAASTVDYSLTETLNATASVTAQATKTISLSANLQSQGFVVAVLGELQSDVANLISTFNLSANAGKLVSAQSSVSATSTLTADFDIRQIANAQLSSVATLSATVQRQRRASANLSTVSSVAVTALIVPADEPRKVTFRSNDSIVSAGVLAQTPPVVSQINLTFSLDSDVLPLFGSLTGPISRVSRQKIIYRHKTFNISVQQPGGSNRFLNTNWDVDSDSTFYDSFDFDVNGLPGSRYLVVTYGITYTFLSTPYYKVQMHYKDISNLNPQDLINVHALIEQTTNGTIGGTTTPTLDTTSPHVNGIAGFTRVTRDGVRSSLGIYQNVFPATGPDSSLSTPLASVSSARFTRLWIKEGSTVPVTQLYNNGILPLTSAGVTAGSFVPDIYVDTSANNLLDQASSAPTWNYTTDQIEIISFPPREGYALLESKAQISGFLNRLIQSNIIELSATTASVVSGNRIRFGVSNLQSTAQAQTTSIKVATANAELQTTASLNCNIGKLTGYASEMSSSATVEIAGQRVRFADASLNSVIESTVLPDLFKGMIVEVNSAADLDIDYIRIRDVDTELESIATQLTAAAIVGDFLIAFDAFTTTTVTAQKTTDVDVTADSEFTQIAQAVKTTEAVVDITAACSINIDADRIKPTNAEFTVTTTLAADATATLGLVDTFSSSADLQIQPLRVRFNASALNISTALICDNQIIKDFEADLVSEFIDLFIITRVQRFEANLTVEGFTLTAGRVVNIDPLRQLRVAREHRVYRVRQETRTIKVPSETRILVI